jgi:hypothetical protein
MATVLLLPRVGYLGLPLLMATVSPLEGLPSPSVVVQFDLVVQDVLEAPFHIQVVLAE